MLTDVTELIPDLEKQGRLRQQMLTLINNTAFLTSTNGHNHHYTKKCRHGQQLHGDVQNLFKKQKTQSD